MFTEKEEEYILSSIKQIKKETHENNIMLRQICKVINYYLRNHSNENMNDFSRNILANLFSNIIDIGRFKL